MQYSNYKDTLQAIAGKIGDVEQEAEEHKYVNTNSPMTSALLAICPPSDGRCTTASSLLGSARVLGHIATKPMT